MPSSVLTLRVNGVDWHGWMSCQITRGVDTLAGGFAIGLADRWQHGTPALPIAAGFLCEVLADGEPLVTGFIDSVSHSLASNSHGISVTGRDRSGDMVDCSAIHSPGQWKNIGVADLAKLLARPFGVGVTVVGDVGAAFSSFQIQQGETAFDALKRALKQRELLALPDGHGGITLAKMATETVTTQLVQGVNILSVDATFDASERFSVYRTDGQKQGTDALFGAVTSVSASVTDDEITRYRPMLLRSGQQGDSTYMRRRASWERTTRRARGTTVRVNIHGWRMDDGKLWPVGQLVPVKIPYLNIDQNLLISRAVFSMSNSGTLTQLELTEADAYKPEPDEPSTATNSASSAGTSDFSLYIQQAMRAEKSSGDLGGDL